jgi:glycosyltransferase involved in cell wall biosynthesis
MHPTPDVVIHHDFGSHFTDFDPPQGAHAVAVRTWDFGPLPRAWVDKINSRYDQLWVHCSWIARQAASAGVDPDRIRVIHHGFDPEVFRPEGPRYQLRTNRQFKFLFVGGMSFRKGTDILLKAFAQSFTAADDVALVIKDNSRDLFYRDNVVREQMVQLGADPMAPEIIHIDRFLPAGELSALYRACDVAVFPYRAEGFCLPILECMAAGTPAIVPRFGACLDFCDESTSFLVRVRRISAPVNRRLTVALGFTDEVAEVDFCEMPVAALADEMRRVYAQTVAERSEKSASGTARARSRFTWNDAVICVQRSLEELLPEKSIGSDSIDINGV